MFKRVIDVVLNSVGIGAWFEAVYIPQQWGGLSITTLENGIRVH